ncbi:ribonuclease H-like domain-containing protein [Tanacetum coccineum]
MTVESSINDQAGESTTFESSSSSPTILLASNSYDNKGKPNTSFKSQNIPQLCNHFNKGTCKFRNRCQFIHDHRNRAGLNSKPSNGNVSRATVYPYSNHLNITNNTYPSRVHQTASQAHYTPRQLGLSAYLTPSHYTSSAHYHPTQPNYTPGPTQPGYTQHVHYATPTPAHYAPHTPQPIYYQTQPASPDILDPAPAHYLSQPTSLASAFSTMTLSDPTWNMDTSASSHLNSSASNLSTIFNKRLFPSVHVGDGNSIPVTNTRHSIIPFIHRPLHLHNVLVTPNIIKNLIFVRQFTKDNNCTIEFDAFGFSVKDFLTRHILFRCDNSGDLYPVTKPSTISAAFVSTSSSTWHQRLGHPGNEVFSTWMAFGENTRDLGSFGEETDEITDLHQILEEILFTERGDGVTSIKRRRHDLFSDDVWKLGRASRRGQLKEDLESST